MVSLKADYDRRVVRDEDCCDGQCRCHVESLGEQHNVRRMINCEVTPVGTSSLRTPMPEFLISWGN